jgi:hypothetical protein
MKLASLSLLLGLLLPFVLSDFTGKWTTSYGVNAPLYVRVGEYGYVHGFSAGRTIMRGIQLINEDEGLTTWFGDWYQGGVTNEDGDSTFGQFELILSADGSNFTGWFDYHLPAVGNDGKKTWVRSVRIDSESPTDIQCMYANVTAFENSLAAFYTYDGTVDADSIALCNSKDRSNHVASTHEEGYYSLTTGPVSKAVYMGDWSYVDGEEIEHGPDMFVSYGNNGTQVANIWWTSRGASDPEMYIMDGDHHGVSTFTWEKSASKDDCLKYFNLSEQSSASKITFSLLSLLAVFVAFN